MNYKYAHGPGLESIPKKQWNHRGKKPTGVILNWTMPGTGSCSAAVPRRNPPGQIDTPASQLWFGPCECHVSHSDIMGDAVHRKASIIPFKQAVAFSTLRQYFPNSNTKLKYVCIVNKWNEVVVYQSDQQSRHWQTRLAVALQSIRMRTSCIKGRCSGTEL